MKPRVCIVTWEMRDIAPAGGIGTASQALALGLSRAGFAVDVLFTNADRGNTDEADGWCRHFAEAYGLTFHTLDMEPSERLKGYACERRAYAVLRHFAGHAPYDVILFHEMCADGYLCLKTRRTCPALRTTRLGVITHYSLLWVDERNAHTRLADPAIALQADLERACVELADFVVSPSRYIVDWMAGRGWRLPKQTRIIPHPYLFTGGRTSRRPSHIENIVFFGRIDERKGIHVFLDALCRVPRSLLTGIEITLLGREGYFDRDKFEAGLHSLLRHTGRAVTREFLLDSQQARAYLRERACLAVMPSPGDNSPCVIYECLTDGIPFVCSNNGGQAELLEPACHAACLCPPRAPDLARKLTELLQAEDVCPPRPSAALLSADEEWPSLLRSETEKARSQYAQFSGAARIPDVCVVVACREEQNSAEAVRSILAQTRKPSEVLLVCAGILPQSILALMHSCEYAHALSVEAYTVAALFNAALPHAHAGHVVLMDDTIRLEPGYIAACAALAEDTGAPVIVTGVRNPRTGEERLSLGGGLPGSLYSFAAVHNLLGGGAIFTETNFARQTGFRDVFAGRCEDWAFLLDAQLQGQTVAVVPDILQDCDDFPISLRGVPAPRDFQSLGQVLMRHGRYAARNLSELAVFELRGVASAEGARQMIPTAGRGPQIMPALPTPVLSNPLSRLAARLAPGLTENLRARLLARRLRHTGAFDAAWYCERYPDVREAGADALLHYLLHGWKEGRDPCPGFSTAAYLNRYPDVLQSGQNPFAHYLLHGKREGRRGQA